jgi:hypothetical protein
LQLFLKGSKGIILHLGLGTLFLELRDIVIKLEYGVSKTVSARVIRDPVTEKILFCLIQISGSII